MESNKQEESNLLNDNPIAAQAGGSWLSKHMGGGVSPLFSKGSMAYQKEEEGSPAKHVKYTKKNIKYFFYNFYYISFAALFPAILPKTCPETKPAPPG